MLLFNDHWLRWTYPSWLTGKLGDFTWLIFAPFVAALVVAWVIPQRIPKHTQIVRATSFAIIGLWFALAKTVPAIYSLTTQHWENLIGWQGSLLMDASDLLALSALPIGWTIWHLSEARKPSRSPITYTIFTLGIVATLASDGPMYSRSDSGITRICQQGTQLLTITEAPPVIRYNPPDNDQSPDPDGTSDYTITRYTNVFQSEDGGIRWTARLEESFTLPETSCSEQGVSTAVDPHDQAIQYRWTPGVQIKRSTDAGRTWVVDYAPIEMQQDVRRFYNRYSTSSGLDGYSRYYLPSPVSGIVDSETGNLVLAMSWDGVLVRTADDGEWHWISLGRDYALADIQDMSRFSNILFFELWLAGALAFLVVTTSTAYIRFRVSSGSRHFLLATGWIGWCVLMTMLLAENVISQSLKGRSFVPGLLALPLLLTVALPLSLGAVWDIARNFRRLLIPITLVAVSTAILFLLPFIFWTRGTIPRYITAWVFAILLVSASLLTGYFYLRKRLPMLEKPIPEKPVHVEALEDGH